MKYSIVAILGALVACGSPPPATMQPQHDGAPARIDLGRALARHPFAPVLAQYDADITVLQRAAGNVPFNNLRKDIITSAAAVDRRLKTASDGVRGLDAQAARPLMRNGGTSRRDFGNDAVASFRQAAQARAARALDLRASQLREHEATVAFDFERAHAGRRLVLGLKLRDLHLDQPTRRRYQAQLDALDRQESALVDAERARDAGILSAYGAALQARALTDSASMASDFAGHARAMREVPQPQVALPDSIRHPKDTRASTVAALDTAGRDLTARWSDLQSMNEAARSAVRTEISDLVRERDALRAQMVASIEARAARVAVAQHLGRVYTLAAPAGARDITDAVLRSY